MCLVGYTLLTDMALNVEFNNRMVRIKVMEEERGASAYIRDVESIKQAVEKSCEKLGLEVHDDFELFLDGTKLHDDDLCDESLFTNGNVVVMSKNVPKSPEHRVIPKTEPVTPVTPKLSRSYTDDTLSIHSDSSRSATPVSRPQTPSMSDLEVEKEVPLPNFSPLLQRGLTESGYKQCSNELWKKVIFPLIKSFHAVKISLLQIVAGN